MIPELVYQAVASPTFVIHGVRKIVQGIYYETSTLPTVDIIKDLSYGKQKVTRLMNLYYNAEEVATAKAKLDERKGEEHSSVSVLMRNQIKDSRSQGWCIQNIVVSTGKTGAATADIFYRSTELIQKFSADMVLIQRVFDSLEVAPEKVRFYFANAYISAVFFPLLFRHVDPIHFLEHIRTHDPKFFFLATKAISRYLDPSNRYTYKAQVRQWKFAQDLERGKMDKYLTKHLKEYHEPHLPKEPQRETIRIVSRRNRQSS
jgi:hypothetical protein